MLVAFRIIHTGNGKL